MELGWLWDTGSDGASLCPLGQPLLEQEYNGNPDSVGYRIRYARSDGRGRAALHVVHDRVEREYTIEDLEEWTEYRVQVQAFNAIGSGPWSHLVLGRTRESGTASPLQCWAHALASPDADPRSCPPLLSPSSAFLWSQQRVGTGHHLQQHAGAMERHPRGGLQRPHPGLQGEQLRQPQRCGSACPRSRGSPGLCHLREPVPVRATLLRPGGAGGCGLAASCRVCCR